MLKIVKQLYINKIEIAYICYTMDIAFSKYQGTGNDFIIINNIDGSYNELSIEQIQRLCDRKFGIGSDGLILINTSDTSDFLMDFFNPDGSKSFCGNGARCAVQFVHEHKIIKNHEVYFDAIDGNHYALVCGADVKLEMAIESIPAKVKLESFNVGDVYYMDTGSPHLVVYANDLSSLETSSVKKIGQEIRYSEAYEAQGINVNFVYIKDSGDISIATYERGVENETLSCGTGATACALVHALKEELKSGSINMNSKGGDLKVTFERQDTGIYTSVYLIGPATSIYHGNIRL